MAITKKQGMAMAAIVIAGVLAGAGVLLTEGHGRPDEAEHAEEAGHGHDEGADETSAHADEGQGADGHGHGHRDEDGRRPRRVPLTEEQAKKAGITVRPAGPASLQTAVDFAGEIRFNEDRTAHVLPRVAGVAEKVMANLGQPVRKGEVLAVIASMALSDQRSELLTAQRRREAARSTFEREKRLWQDRISAEQDYLAAQAALLEADIAVQNATQKLAAIGATRTADGLNRLEIRAPFDGTVVEKHLALGEAVKEDASIFTLSDLRTVWAEFNVAPKDLATVRVGQRVLVSSTAFAERVEGTVSYVGALLGEQTRTARARVTLTNPKGAWRPGLFVTVSVYGDSQDVPLAVDAAAVQTIENQPMVFKAVPGGYEASPIQVGRADGRTVEVLGGLKAGEPVASGNTFVLKSELGKSSAGHGH